MTMGNAGKMPGTEESGTDTPATGDPVAADPGMDDSGIAPASEQGVGAVAAADPASEPAMVDPASDDAEAAAPDAAKTAGPASAPIVEMSTATTREAQVRAALERVLASPDLCTSPRLGAFLSYVVDATLNGRADQIKGYTIAVEALGRPTTFDPQADPIVRVEATRLRRALQNYYNTVGQTDPIQIHIPKGGYVPQFQDRPFPDRPFPDRAEAGAAPSLGPVLGVAVPAGEPGLAEPTALAAIPAAPAEPTEALGLPLPGSVEESTKVPPVPEAPRSGWRRWTLGAGVALAAVLVVGLRISGLMEWPEPVEALLGVQAPLADRVRLPIVEVGQFELGEGAEPAAGDAAVSSRGPDRAELRSIEERLRDSFALFDFVEVRAGSGQSSASSVVRACGGRRARSVFTLGGFVEGQGDGSYTLRVHLTDRCEGTIVWSHAISGLKPGMGGAGEERVVREIAPTLLDRYGVVSVRARSQVLAHAPGSGFGCIAQAFSVLRNDGAALPSTPRACLGELVDRDGEFALGHAVRAAAMLDEALREAMLVEPQEQRVQMLREAELAADLAPSSAYALRTLALVQLFLGETESALASAEQALRLNPLDQDIAATVGTIFIGAGRVEQGEAMLLAAREQGATRTPLQEAYLAIAAFLRADRLAAEALVPQLQLHPHPGNRLALALALHALDRSSDEREALHALARQEGGGAEAVRRLVQHLLPAPAVAERALHALESAGLSQELASSKRPHG